MSDLKSESWKLCFCLKPCSFNDKVARAWVKFVPKTALSESITCKRINECSLRMLNLEEMAVVTLLLFFVTVKFAYFNKKSYSRWIYFVKKIRTVKDWIN